jgi:hypothetical protein
MTHNNDAQQGLRTEKNKRPRMNSHSSQITATGVYKKRGKHISKDLRLERKLHRTIRKHSSFSIQKKKMEIFYREQAHTQSCGHLARWNVHVRFRWGALLHPVAVVYTRDHGELQSVNRVGKTRDRHTKERPRRVAISQSSMGKTRERHTIERSRRVAISQSSIETRERHKREIIASCKQS